MTIERWPCLVAQCMGFEASSPPTTLGLAPFYSISREEEGRE